MSRIWKNVIYICLMIVKGEYWLVLCLALPSQDFFSLSPTQCLVDCAVCLAGTEIAFLLSSLFLTGNTAEEGGKVVNIKEKSAAKLSDGKTGHLVCIKSNVAAQ